MPILSLLLIAGCPTPAAESCDEAAHGSSGASYPSSGDSGGDSGDPIPSSSCSDVEDDLDGVWITPEDAEEDPANGFYNTLEFDAASHTGEVNMYAYGASQTVPIADWRIEGDCDEIHVDYGGGFEREYSVIHELTSTSLDLEATDGSYYGQRTRYRRSGSTPSSDSGGDSGDSGGDSGGDSDTCAGFCSSDSDCGVGEACLNTEQGYLCMPEGCDACFDSGGSCGFNTASCEYLDCDAGESAGSSTCENGCSSSSDCEVGEACFNTASYGYICIPASCGGCFDNEQTCSWNSSTCDFAGCS